MKTEEEIKNLILGSIENEPILNEALKRINIKVENSTVILIGRIDTHEHHQHLIRFISRFEDLRILTDITVEPDMSESSGDNDLKKLIVGTLRSAGMGPGMEIKVSRGRVYLEGKVYSEDDRTRIYKIVERIFGVRAICNNLTFPRVNVHHYRRMEA